MINVGKLSQISDQSQHHDLHKLYLINSGTNWKQQKVSNFIFESDKRNSEVLSNVKDHYIKGLFKVRTVFGYD